MSTTLWIDPETRDRLHAIKRRHDLPSLAAAIRALLDAPQETAEMVFNRRRPQVVAACKKHRVLRLIAFGSRARGDARPDSDLDVAVELPQGIGLEVVTALQDIDQAFAVPADIIPMPHHRPRLMANIERDGVVLYRRP